MSVRACVKEFLAIALVVTAGIACSSSEVDDSAPSSEAGFCDALAGSYAKCSGGGGPSASCSTSLGADCAKLASILSPSILDSAKSCVVQTTCGSDPLGCIGKSLAKATPSAAQTKLADDYCDSCSVVGGEACKTAFFGNASVPGLAIALLPFGDGPVRAVDEACTKSALGKTACQAAFSTCLGATTTKFLATSISVDAAKCLLDGIKNGISAAGRDGKDGGGGDGSATGCAGCAGCCQDGVCQQGDDPLACGSGGGSCESCQGGAACVGGTCASTCGPDNCAGCCTADGTCATKATTSACGAGGQACTACGSSKTCERGACIDASCKASCTAGCCSASGCQAGTTAAACGTGAAACAVCGAGQTCTAGVCTPSGTATFDFVAVGARLPAKNASGADWDAFGGLPDAFVKATSGGANGTSPNRRDTLTPIWNATLLTGLTTSALKASLEVEVWDADIAFHDRIGGCTIALKGLEFDGALHTANCPATAGAVALSLDYRLKAR